MCFRIHKPRDSLLSWSAQFNNYEGVINWAFLLLCIGGLRLTLENFNKYGIRVDPRAWLSVFRSEGHDHEEYPTIFLFLCK